MPISSNFLDGARSQRRLQQPVSLSSKTFAQSGQIAAEIDSLETKPSVLLQGGDPIEQKRSTPKAAITLKAAPKRRIALPKNVTSAAPNGSGDGRGTLRPA